MILAFTGTRRGMTARQKKIVEEFIEAQFRMWFETRTDKTPPFEIRHGAAIGADIEFHAMIAKLPIPRVQIYPANHADLAVKQLVMGRIVNMTIHEPKAPLDRNEDIVKGASLLLACPAERRETLRSGTWTTARRADKHGIKIIVVAPEDLSGQA